MCEVKGDGFFVCVLCCVILSRRLALCVVSVLTCAVFVCDILCL